MDEVAVINEPVFILIAHNVFGHQVQMEMLQFFQLSQGSGNLIQDEPNRLFGEGSTPIDILLEATLQTLVDYDDRRFGVILAC
jgi:hypothetical protein